MIVKALEWIGDVDGFLELIDQRKLPGDFVKMQCRDIETLSEAIKNLAVRGAPAIGVCAAYGLVLSMQRTTDTDSLDEGIKILSQSVEYLALSRPTAVNLFWAIRRVQKKARQFVTEHPDAAFHDLRKVILAEANAIYQEDVDMCRRIGRNGQRFITDGDGILTHCNAGALATAGQGTALSILFEAHKNGKKFRVYADETRPLLQGSRLTAWELKQAGIDVTVICDNMAGWMMKQGEINAVITGADRIAANGDTANKIGTYGLSILAREHGVPFYIAAPSSTFDLSIKSGSEIPIEQRASEEVTEFAQTRIAPHGVNVCNPAFDVTDARDITAIITDKGVIEKPDSERILELLGDDMKKR
jgi:methylthioribose-1-phosphate isomerase